MAELALKKLEDQLNCPVCFNAYTDPKQLQCHHIYCQGCLGRLAVQNHHRQLVLTCPNCRQVTPVPASGVAGLPAAFHISNLLELRDILKEQQKKDKDGAPYCADHQERELELYCESCEQLICLQCTIAEHNGHKYNLVKHDMLEKCREEIKAALVPAKVGLSAVSKASQLVRSQRKEVTDRQATLEAKMHNESQQLIKIIQARTKEHVGKLRRMTEEKLRDLDFQGEQLDAIETQLKSCVEMVLKTLETGIPAKILSMKAATISQVKELTTSLQTVALEPIARADMEYFTGSEIAELCQNYGEVSSTQHEGLEAATFGEKSPVHLPAVEKFSTPMLTIDRVKRPWGVATCQGEVVVTEWGGHCVSVFRPNGERLRSFGTRGSGPGQFIHPAGLAVDSDGNILVADFINKRIQKFSAVGEFLAAVGTRGSGPLQFLGPMGIAVNKINKKVYVVDTHNARVQVCNSDLTFSSTFGTKGTGKGQLDQPLCVACDCSGTVYVSDDKNHRVQVFTADGKFLRMFGAQGEGKGRLRNPRGVAVDNNKMVYVTDQNHHVSVFTSEGQFVSSFGRSGTGKGDFLFPIGVAIEGEEVYVCDTDNDRIQKNQQVMKP